MYTSVLYTLYTPVYPVYNNILLYVLGRLCLNYRNFTVPGFGGHQQ